jgi:hypothetical protein
VLDYHGKSYATIESSSLKRMSNVAPTAALIIAMAALCAGQTPSWTAPRRPDGQPDLQGIWNTTTITPLERPKEFAQKQILTADEAAAYEQRVVSRRDAEPDGPDSVADPAVWWERGTKVVSTRRTSLVVDPPDGRVPSLTAEAQKRMQDSRAETRRHPADGPQDRSLQERCLLSNGTGPPMLPGPYNNDYQIVQTPGYVMILIEMIHDVRIIPLDGRPHLAQDVRLWMGDSRAHWEGESLVVDTTNFTDKTHYRGSDQNLRLVERFTRTGPETILYQFTVDDPTAFTKPWTAEIPMQATVGPIYEFACHEGNRAMENMLRNARAEERQAEEAAK